MNHLAENNRLSNKLSGIIQYIEMQGMKRLICKGRRRLAMSFVFSMISGYQHFIDIRRSSIFCEYL